jgi:hypothetical protein
MPWTKTIEPPSQPPTASVTNPTGTVAALAYRAADALGESYFKPPGELPA